MGRKLHEGTCPGLQEAPGRSDSAQQKVKQAGVKRGNVWGKHALHPDKCQRREEQVAASSEKRKNNLRDLLAVLGGKPQTVTGRKAGQTNMPRLEKL